MKNDPFKEKPKTIGVYNPLTYDFSVNYDISGKGKPEPITVRSQEIEYFVPYLAEHIKKHLLDAVIDERDVSPLDQQTRDEILKEISV